MAVNIMRAKLKRCRLSPQSPGLPCDLLVLAFPGQHQKRRRTKESVENSLTGSSEMLLIQLVSLAFRICATQHGLLKSLPWVGGR